MHTRTFAPVTLCVVFINIVLFAEGDIEKVIHETHSPINVEHYPDGEHNADFDHEAILGPDQGSYDNLPAEVAKEKLGLLAAKIDINHDGYVQEQELTSWIMQMFMKMDEQEAFERFNEQDVNGDLHVDWEEIVEKVYGYKLKELNEFIKDQSKEMKAFIQMVDWDKKKFNVADQDKNGRLDVDEFAAYLHPQNYPHMNEVEILRALDDHDQNKDGVIDFPEFLGDSVSDKEHEIYEKEQFEAFDNNHDGKLQGEEIQGWVIPDQKAMAEEEMQHLFLQTDTNKDKKLSIKEIVNKHQLWVGSQATDYGRHLHDSAEL